MAAALCAIVRTVSTVCSRGSTVCKGGGGGTESVTFDCATLALALRHRFHTLLLARKAAMRAGSL